MKDERGRRGNPVLEVPVAEVALPEFIYRTPLPGVLVCERPTYDDGRGSFHEVVRIGDLEAALGYPVDVRQQNESANTCAGTLRGIHFAPWGKLVHASHGTVQVAIVDGRPGSSTFGQVWTEVLGARGRNATVWVPAGCGNSYLTLDPDSKFFYSSLKSSCLGEKSVLVGMIQH
jgi:dTDP-4-dehydrorhamnose 3,5-epimerase-like enzyme